MSTRYNFLISLDNQKKAKGFFTARISRIRPSELASEPRSEPAARNQAMRSPLVYLVQRLSDAAWLARPNLGRGRSEIVRESSERAELPVAKYRTE
jgi:hypothetical protein